jgi:hypothetical protein
MFIHLDAAEYVQDLFLYMLKCVGLRNCLYETMANNLLYLAASCGMPMSQSSCCPTEDHYLPTKTTKQPATKNTCFSKPPTKTLLCGIWGIWGIFQKCEQKHRFRIGPRDPHIRIQRKPLLISLTTS